METTIDSVSVQIESNSSKAAESIDKLVASINKIKNATTVGIQGLNNLNIAINNIKTGFNSLNVNNLDKTTQKMKELKNTAKTLSGKFTVPKIETGAISNDKLISSTEQYGKLIKKEIVDGQVRAKTYIDISNGIKTTTTITGKAITQTQKYVNEQNKLTKALKVFKGLGIFQILKGIFNGISNLTGQSAKYIADVNYFNTSMGKMQKQADEFVNNMSKDFYLDPGNLRRYMASFNTLIKGFGIGSEAAYTMSKNLTQLSYDYSALTGIDVEDMMQKLKSGISGELEPMRAIGIALDQNTLQLTANTLGIKKKVSAMTRAQKTELLYYQIMKSTEYAQNAFSRSLALSTEELKNSSKVTLTPATALSILKQQYTQLGRAIGNIFIPILVRMTPYVIAVTQLLTQAAQAIAAFFGFKITDYSIGSGLDNVSSGIEDIGNAADDTKKKAKAMLAPFDELNAIDFGSKSSGIGSSIGGGSLGLDPKEYDWLKSDKLTNKVEDIKKKFDMVKDVVIAIGTAILTWKIGKKIVDFFDKLGVLQKTDGLKFLAGLSLTISGLTLIYNGLNKVMKGEVTAGNVLEVAFGGALTYVGTSLMFKTPVSVGVTLALTLDIILLTSIIGWWNKYYDEIKQELYNNKKDLNLAEFLNVSFTAVGTGVGNFVDNILGQGFTDSLGKYFQEHPVAKTFLGSFIDSLSLGVMHSEIQKGLETDGQKVGESFIGAAINLITNPSLGVPMLIQAIYDGIDIGFPKLINLTKTKVKEIGENISSGWENIKNGTKTKIKEIGENTSSGLENIKNNIKTKVKGIEQNFSDGFSSAKNNILLKFDEIKNGINDKITNAKNTVKRSIDNIKSFFNFSWSLPKLKVPHLSWTTTQASGWIAKTLEALGLPTSLPKLNISWYKDGGFPSVGELFVAGEAGPEWISTMGGSTAVANQDQMTTGIRQAAYEGVSQALKENPQSLSNEIYIGNDKVYSGMATYENYQSNKYGTTRVKV